MRGAMMSRGWRFVAGVALIGAAASVFLSVLLFRQQAHERSGAVAMSCHSANATTDGLVRAIKAFLVASVAQDGDMPLPRGERNPFKWTDVRPGPLTRSIAKAVPGYPPAKARLRVARRRAEEFDAGIPRRDCAAELRALSPP